MGKSWKRKDQLVAADTPLDYKWSSQSYTLREILVNFKLPVVVQCREETSAEHVQNFFFDLRQPVLLHSKRTSRKVFARCVRKGPGGTVKELLPEVVIPEDYAGWFKISKGLTFDKPYPHKTIENLAASPSEFFLCTTEFDALILPDVPEGEEEVDAECFHRVVAEGEVMRKTGIQKLNQIMLPESFRHSKDNRFLMCIDEKDMELFIPLSQSGLFYEVSDGNFKKDDNCVVQISDLLDEMVVFPLYLRHILGDPPPISKFYSPCLKLDRAREEETVMGSTLDAENEDLLPLEIQTSSPIKFEIALNTPMLQSNIDYLEALEMCSSVGKTYITDMKLAVNFKANLDDDASNDTHVYSNHSFVPDENETVSTVSNSIRTSIASTAVGSELGEVGANSEFNIQWEPSPCASNNRRQPSEISTECNSIESVEEGNEHFVDADNIDDNVIINNQMRFNCTEDVDGTLKAEREGDVVLGSNEGVEITPFVDIVEGITDFSVFSNPRTSTQELKKNIVPKLDLSLPLSKPFDVSKVDSESVNSSQTIVQSSHHSSTVSIASERTEIDLSDHFPSISSNSYESLAGSAGKGSLHSNTHSTASDYTFTGDVFINHATEDGDLNEQNQDLDGSDWSDKYRVIKSKDMTRYRGSYERSKQTKSKDLSNDLMSFEKDQSKVPPEGIITCTVADEMMSSYNDLRLSLEEVTKNARDRHAENTWSKFCFERSCSLPVRTRNVSDKPKVNTEDHSQSWEQISPRRTDRSTSSSARTGTTSSSKKKYGSGRRLNKMLAPTDPLLIGDRTQLITDTSSEDSAQYSYRSNASFDSANSSFAASDVSDKDLPDTFLSEVNEMRVQNSVVFLDGSVQKANTLTRDKSALAKKMKVKREIKKKKIAEWDGRVSEI